MGNVDRGRCHGCSRLLRCPQRTGRSHRLKPCANTLGQFNREGCRRRKGDCQMSIDMTDTSKDLERQADASRAELSETLETLKDKLTPGQIFDDMFGGSSANAGAFLKNLGTSMRDNPMPA